MTLNGPQQGKVYAALLAVFKQSELERMLRYELDVELMEVAGGDNYQDIVASLVHWFCSVDRHLDLIRVAHDKRRGCSELQAIAQEFLQQPKPIQSQETNLPRFPEVCEFDLRQPIRQAISHLDDKNGLIGLAIPCVEAKLQIKFCERLKKRMGRRETVIRDPLKLDYRTSVEEILKRIKRYERSLDNGRDVICPIEISESGEGVVETLWMRLSEHFQSHQTNNRLIIFLHGRGDEDLPGEVHQIPPPTFDEMDVRDWVYDIAERLNWQEKTWRDWKQCMVDYCCKDEDAQALDIFWVYEHLDFSMRLLQNQVSEQDFIKKLELGP